jgi:hypothetical protein
MSFVEIMVFHLMADTKRQSIMEYHETERAVAGTILVRDAFSTRREETVSGLQETGVWK